MVSAPWVLTVVVAVLMRPGVITLPAQSAAILLLMCKQGSGKANVVRMYGSVNSKAGQVNSEVHELLLQPAFTHFSCLSVGYYSSIYENYLSLLPSILQKYLPGESCLRGRRIEQWAREKKLSFHDWMEGRPGSKWPQLHSAQISGFLKNLFRCSSIAIS